MSRSAIFFLLVPAPALGLVLGLLGLETLGDNLLGWVLLLTGVGYSAGAIASYWVRKIPFWQAGGRVTSEEKGDRSFWAIIPGMLAAFFAPPLEYMYAGAILPRLPGMQIAGMVLVILGATLGIWARSALRGMYSGHVQVTAEQVLMIRGPYGLVRHPGYTGFLLAALGIAIGYSSLAGLVAIVVLLGPALAYRIGVEETLLESRFGDPYRLYQGRVRRLIPGIW
ncbi:MAG: methyltransferase family protein [Bacteroidota bacterium]